MQRLLDESDVLNDAVLAAANAGATARYHRWLAAYDPLACADRVHSTPADTLRRDFSIVVPLVGAHAKRLRVLGDSLLAQVYRHWHVRFVLPPGPGQQRADLVGELCRRDSRFRERVAGWSEVLGDEEHDVLLFVDPNVSLHPHALLFMANSLAERPDAVVVYADEDTIDSSGKRSRHYFKPDFNAALLRSQNYLGGLVLLRRATARAAGGWADDGVWGLFLRVSAVARSESIQHLPFVLSHRFCSHGGESADARFRGARVLEHCLANIGEDVRAEPVGEKSYRLRYVAPKKLPRVTVIIPTTCDMSVLRPCLDGVLNRTSYRELEVLVVRTNHRESSQVDPFLDEASRRPHVRLLTYEPRPFNFSKVNNWAAEQAMTELLCFLNDDTQVISDGWLTAMVCRMAEGVGAVGALLLYPTGRIQHAGVLLGAGSIAAHSYARRRSNIFGYHDRAVVDQDVSCVTAACMLIRRDAFFAAGAFDPELRIAFNDVDLCLRLRRRGWRIVWTPAAKLYHRESTSIGRHDVGARAEEWRREAALMQERWAEELVADPHYSPNLSLDPLQLWQPAFPPRVGCKSA
jgi:GT2 family glycosyltransferase